jgi:CRISPR/Cas system-associated exonuclease Cas4 (RecB family)
MIHEAYTDGLHLLSQRSYGPRRVLYVSEIGRCPRSVMLRVQGAEPTHPFSDYLLDIMGLGVLYEDDTVRKVSSAGRDWRMVTQYRLRNGTWSGKVDLAIVQGESNWTLVEHKAKGNLNLGYLPQSEHLMQLLLYGQLFEEKHGFPASLVLYYRSWGEHYEVEVDPAAGVCRSSGYESRFYPDEVTARRSRLEELLAANEVPSPYREPVEGECVYRGEPSCKYYGHCYG